MGAERKIVRNAVFGGKRHDNKIWNVQILLSRNFVVILCRILPVRQGRAEYGWRTYMDQSRPLQAKMEQFGPYTFRQYRGHSLLRAPEWNPFSRIMRAQKIVNRRFEAISAILRETKDIGRVSLQEYLLTRSSKVSSKNCGFFFSEKSTVMGPPGGGV